MSECEQYSGLRKMLCQGFKVDRDGTTVKLSENEHARWLASFRGEPLPPKETPPRNRVIANQAAEGVGVELEKLFKSIKFSTCGACARLRDDLNKWGPAKCELYKDDIVRRLENNAKRRPELNLLFSRTGAELFVDQAILNARRRIAGVKVPRGAWRNLVDVASAKINRALPARSAGKSLTWSYGVTTVPSRVNDLLPRTLNSLAAAGFDNPHLFVDDATDAVPYERFNLACTFHWANLKTYGNWITSLWELYIADPHADRYAIFQDDLIAYRNLREYLDASPYPGSGYLNLYTYPNNHNLVKNKPTGWHLSNQLGKGAVALVFNNQAVTDLLSDGYLLRRIQNSERGHRFVDGAIVEAFRKMGQKEFVHHPSLVQHTGVKSSMGNNAHSESPSWAGEVFDARELMRG